MPPPPLHTDFFRKLLCLHHCSSPFYQPKGLIGKVGDSLLISYIWPAMFLLPEKETEWWPSKTRAWVLSADTHTQNLNTYQRLWPQSRGESVRRRRWETRGWRISWAQSPAALDGCKDPGGSRGAAVITGTSESNVDQWIMIKKDKMYQILYVHTYTDQPQHYNHWPVRWMLIFWWETLDSTYVEGT